MNLFFFFFTSGLSVQLDGMRDISTMYISEFFEANLRRQVLGFE